MTLLLHPLVCKVPGAVPSSDCQTGTRECHGPGDTACLVSPALLWDAHSRASRDCKHPLQSHVTLQYMCMVLNGFVSMQLVDLEEVILPGNARLLYHDNECYDWGTLGWIMAAGIADVEDYKHFVMINSSVRGPYAPPFQPVRAPDQAPSFSQCHMVGANWNLCCPRSYAVREASRHSEGGMKTSEQRRTWGF